MLRADQLCLAKSKSPPHLRLEQLELVPILPSRGSKEKSSDHRWTFLMAGFSLALFFLGWYWYLYSGTMTEGLMFLPVFLWMSSGVSSAIVLVEWARSRKNNACRFYDREWNSRLPQHVVTVIL